jgi:hypothetical protein
MTEGARLGTPLCHDAEQLSLSGQLATRHADVMLTQ